MREKRIISLGCSLIAKTSWFVHVKLSIPESKQFARSDLETRFPFTITHATFKWDGVTERYLQAVANCKCDGAVLVFGSVPRHMRVRIFAYGNLTSTKT
jgi:hypothetical protein